MHIDPPWRERDRVLELVEEALNTGRTAEQVCADDPHLLADVRRQLQQCQINSAELDVLFSTSAPRAGAASGDVQEPGTSIGPYQLLEPIGEGGFGTVYAAEQLRPVRRHVAVKVIKPGMDTREVIARFEAERQTLAMMDHPNIARVFDAGATAAGRPYFVMELVRGVPITAYCDQAKLTVRRRVELMLPVCHAVQSAHQKGVIHRDLKPSNVLVTILEGAAVPKIIDFGIAKATAGPANEDPLLTRLGLLVGTPAYMSPEQADRTSLGVDTRADVYGLGVMLYELLTGTPPIEHALFKNAPPGDAARLVREVNPPPPSVRLSAAATGAAAEIAAARGTDARRLRQQVRRELDWIVMKAIEKDRARRYQTAAALVDDLGRYLVRDPVTAGPPGTGYRLRRYARKNRVLLIVAAVVASALLLGVAGLSVGLVRAAGARRLAELREREADAQRRLAEQRKAEADLQRRSAEAVVVFLTQDVLGRASPDVTTDQALRETLVKALVEPALLHVGQRFQGEPLVRACVQYSLADTLNALGRPDLALPQAQAAWRARQAALGDADPLTIKAMDQCAVSLYRQHQWAAVEPLVWQEWQAFRRAEGDDAPDTINALIDYAGVLVTRGKRAQAKRVLADSVDADRRAGRAETLPFARLLAAEGKTLRMFGDWKSAIAPLRQSTELFRRIAPGDPEQDEPLFWLGMCLMVDGREGDAASTFREKLLLDRRSPNPKAPRVLLSKDLVEALTVFEQDHAPMGRAARVLCANLCFSVAEYQIQSGDPARATWWLQEATELFRAGEPESPYRGRALYWLGCCVLVTGRPAEAESIFRENLAYDVRRSGRELSVLPGSLQGILASRVAQGKSAEPEAILSEYRPAKTP